MTSQNNLTELIQLTKALNAYEMLLVPEATPRTRRKNEWVPLEKSILSASETRKIFLSILSDEQRKYLFDHGQFEGIWHGSDQRFFCQIQVSNQGLHGSLSWVPEELTQKDFWGFPKWTETSLARGRGVHILTARNRLHLEAAAASLIQGINQSHQKMIYWQKKETLTSSPSESSVVVYGTHDQVPESCDLYVCEGLDRLDSALGQARCGRSVLLLLQSHSTTEAIAQIGDEKALNCIANYFQWALGVKVLEGVQGWVPVFDLVAGVEPIRELIKTQKTAEIDKWMEQERNSGFDGVRSMNQALLQLMLKRKIDLRQGFEESPAPEKLDLLLKKVGF
jgi:Tfp pilus assembly pilus retraction ATPase PilT